MGAVLIGDDGALHHAEVEFADHAGGFEGVAAAFIAEVGASHAFEFTVEERDDLRSGLGVATSPVAEELRDFARVGAVFREHDFRIAGAWGAGLSHRCKLKSIHG